MNNTTYTYIDIITKEINRIAKENYNQGYTDALDIDMDKPMHFTDEQRAWIKKYLSINGERQRIDGARKFAEWFAECKKVSEPIKEYTINR